MEDKIFKDACEFASCVIANWSKISKGMTHEQAAAFGATHLGEIVFPAVIQVLSEDAPSYVARWKENGCPENIVVQDLVLAALAVRVVGACERVYSK